MLEGLRRRGAPAESVPERDLVGEREALAALLKHLDASSAPVHRLADAVGKLEARVAAMETRTTEAARQLADVATAAAAVGTLADKVRDLANSVRDARQTADRLVAPDGDLQQQRHVVQQLMAQSLQSRATLETLSAEQERLEALRAEVRLATEQMQQARALVTASSTEIDAVKTSAAAAETAQAATRALAASTKEDAAQAVALIQTVDQKLQGLTKLQDLARNVEERTSALNSLVEHVTQKAKVLEHQKASVETAVLESHRVTELVRSMESQVVRLDAASRRGADVEEMVERVETTLRQSGQQLQAAERSRDALAADLAALDRNRASLMDFVRQHEDRLAAGRRELDAHQSRVTALHQSVAGLEQAHERLAVRGPEVDALRHRLDALTAQLGEFDTRATTVAEKMASLDEIHEHLVSVDEMSRRATWQMQSLAGARQDLEDLRADIEQFYKDQTDARQLRDNIAVERAALESFLDRMSAFAVQVPELDARMNAIKSKLSIVDEGTAKAANLVAIADDLDRQTARLSGHQAFLERVETRLNALNVLTADVDKRLDEQTRRRGEVESLRNLCESVGIEVTDIRQKLDGIDQTQTKLLPITAQIASLKADVDRAQSRLAGALQDQAMLTSQERRITEMLEHMRALGSETSAHLAQAQGLSNTLGRSEAMKETLLKELALVQGQQQAVAGHLETADAQMKSLSQIVRGLEQRHDQLAFSEKRISGFEGKIAELKDVTETIERRIQDVVARDETVRSIRREVEGVHDISARSKADLQHLDAHRGDITALRSRVDELLATAQTTEQRIAEINAHRQLVDEVQLKVAVTSNMLHDVRVHLETVGEQKAVLDHVLEQVARLDSMSREAQATMRSLQAERELAERIEKSIQSLRARTAPPETKRLA
jgi:chromosome segregation ATPase